MSYSNAIQQRQEMVEEYEKMLLTETNSDRISDINKQIELCQDEISQLKIGKPLFGKPTKLTQETRIITADPETKSQKIEIINPRIEDETPSVVLSESKDEVGQPITTPSKNPRLENELRKKIQAAKAVKKA
jgi:hypothetical protein